MPGYMTMHQGSHPSIHQPDVTLILDHAGIIRQARFADDLPGGSTDAWVGRPWIETVGDGGSDKIRDMLDNALERGVSAFRLVTQRFPNGTELPVEYSMVRLGGTSGLMAIGKNQQAVTELETRLIASQHAREHDYWKLREVETRYRLLFDASHEAVLLIRADDLTVVEANLAAMRVFDVAPGHGILSQIPEHEHDMLRSMLARVREQGRAPGLMVHPGATRAAWIVRASLMAADPGQLFLLQLAPARGVAPLERLPIAPPIPVKIQTAALPIDELVERLPDAFVVVDQEGEILRANPAFLDMVQAGGMGSVVGANLGRWLQRPGADASVLLGTLQRHHSVRQMATTIQSELGSETAIEISAAADQADHPHHIGVILRDVSRRAPTLGLPAPGPPTPAQSPTPGFRASLAALDDQIGQTPLPRLMRETVELLERHYIEAALERAGGNRTATAELLGLSRQSLYVKLNRYGLDGDSASTSDPTD